MIVILLIALTNLALGYGVAVHLGWAVWPGQVKAQADNPAHPQH